MPRVRLTQKFATVIAGVDLRHFKAGASLNVTPAQARQLIDGGGHTREYAKRIKNGDEKGQREVTTAKETDQVKTAGSAEHDLRRASDLTTMSARPRTITSRPPAADVAPGEHGGEHCQ